MYKNIAILIVASLFLASCTFLKTDIRSPEDKLYYGIVSGNLNMVQKAVENDADINHFTKFGYYGMSPYGKIVTNPFLIAVFRAEYSIADYLLSHNVDVNIDADIDGRSILQYCMSYSTELTERIIQKGADLEHTDEYGYTTVDYAIMSAESKTHGMPYYMLISEGVTPTEKNLKNALKNLTVDTFGIVKNMIESYNLTEIDPVLASAFRGDGATVREVFSDYPDKQELATVAGAFCDTETVHCIIDASYDIPAILKAAIEYNNIEVVDFFLNEYKQYITPTNGIEFCVAASNSPTILKKLMEYDFLLSEQRLISGCIEHNSLEILEYLYDNKIDAVYESGLGSPMWSAVLYNNADAVKLHVEYNSDFNGTDQCNPLVMACKRGYYNIIKILVDAGADVNFECIDYEKSTNGKATPLSAAIEFGDKRCITYLLEHGADKNHVFDDGSSISDIAEQYEMKEFVFG